MADALCGPSNALQSFQKHASVDRTLQQDRLRSRQSPSQAFRSPEPHAGLLDPEFEAFQAGLPAGPSPADFQHFQPHFAPQVPAPAFAASSGLPGWAADFQRLHVSSPPPSVATQSPNFAPQSPSAWHRDFLRQGSLATRSHVNNAAPAQPLYSGMAGFPLQNSLVGMNGMGGAYMSPVAQGKQREEQPTAQFDDAAFERAFDAAREEMLQEHEHELTMADVAAMKDANADIHAATEALSVSLDQLSTDISTNHLAAEAQLQASRSLEQALQQEPGHEENFFDILAREEAAEQQAAQALAAAQEEQRQQQHQHPENGDELAHTAGQLLNSLADNTSKKFQESQFLALMRRLRDREVHVHGDKMVETATIPALEQDADAHRSTPPPPTTMTMTWSPPEDSLLAAQRRDGAAWDDVAAQLTGRSADECRARYRELAMDHMPLDDGELRRRFPWP